MAMKSGRPLRRGAGTINRVPAVSAAAALAALALTTNLWMRHPTPSSDPFLCLIAFDVSDSVTPEERLRLVNACRAAHQSAFPDGTRVIVCTFASSSWKAYDGSPRQWKELSPVFDQWVLHAPPVARGTSPGQALGEILVVAREADQNRVPICLIEATDGEDNNTPMTRQQVRELSGLPHLVAAWVIGAEADPRVAVNLRKQVEYTHAPLGDRLVVSGSTDAKDGLKRFTGLIARREH